MKRRIVNYTFDKVAGTVTFTDAGTIKLESVLLIVNVTDGIIIFNFADSAKTGTVTGSSNVLTLTFDTSSMNNADFLLILYDEGDVLHDSVDVGAPMKMGLKAIAHGANPSDVAAGDRTDWYANRHGIPFVIGGHPHIRTFEYNTTNVSGETDDSILGAIAPGTKVVVTMLDATCDKANSNDTGVRIGFGASTLPAEGASGDIGVGQIILSHPGIAAGSGVVKGSGAGIIGIGGDGEELRITNENPGGKLRVLITFYSIES